MAEAPCVYVAPDGDDQSSGTLDRPVRSAARGLHLLRQQRRAAGKVGGRLIFRGGTHLLDRPLVLSPKDSGIAPTATNNTETDTGEPLVISAYRNEKATLSGGKRIGGWKTTTINGVSAWVASVPAIKRGTWVFNQLWVNGRRADRTRLPETGLFRIVEPLDDPQRTAAHASGLFRGHITFRYADDDLREFYDLQNAEFVALHFWIESRVPFKAIDPQSKTAELAWRPRMQLTDDYEGGGAVYYVENVREALRKPGQWYADRPAGKVYYIPRRGEKIESAEVIAPAIGELLRLEGDALKGQFVEHVHIERLTFSHNEYRPTEAARVATPQAACHVPGAVVFHGAKRCTIDQCTVEHVGSYGVEVVGGSVDCEITRTTVRDSAAGGIKVFHTVLDTMGSKPDLYAKGQPWLSSRRITISDCHLHDGGYRYRQAVGVLIGRCSGCRVIHNHIHDFDYTGISVGWLWGYGEGDCYGNIVEYNHIHDIGRGVLSDMGGIYTLGQQQGTRLRYNTIHDVNSRGYGGWGIYTDEGSTDILVESNLVYRTKSQGFHQHYGRRTIVQNNIFAFGREGQMRISRVEAGHVAAVFRRNIIIADVPATWQPDKWIKENPGIAAHLECDGNLYWCTNRKAKLEFGDKPLAQWQRMGLDRNSILANPAFADAANGDFTLTLKSPAIRQLGFVPWDLRQVGIRATTNSPARQPDGRSGRR